MASRIQKYLKNLGPSQAFGVFFLSCVVGGLCIAGDIGTPWSPPLLVALYGLLLLYAQTKFFVQLDETIKDSPYFLGFLFTLLAILFVFLGLLGNGSPAASELGTEVATLSKDTVRIVIRGLAVALSTTIVGVLMRQWLYAKDPVGELAEDQYRSLLQQLRGHAATFSTAQRDLVELIEEFVKNRETLFTREEAALGRYVDSVEASESLFAAIEKEYPQRLDDILSAVESASGALSQAADSNTVELKRVRDSLAGALVEHEKSYRAILADSITEAEATRDSYRTQLESIGVELNAAVQLLRQQLEGLRDVESGYGKAVGGLEQSVTRLGSNVKLVGQGLKGTADDIDVFRSEVVKVPPQLRATADSLQKTSTDMHSEVKKSIELIAGEVKELDSLFEEVTKLLERRLSQGTE